MDPVSPPIRDLIDLFNASLNDVTFGDLSAAALDAKADAVRAASTHLAALQASLDAARAVYDAEQDALGQMSQRAMAYARVYAENDAELTAKLDAIPLPLPRAARRNARPVMAASTSATASADSDPAIAAPPDSSPRRRGRPRKEAVDAMQAELAAVPF
jgi:ABC-type transporter Mla subunit MlaD